MKFYAFGTSKTQGRKIAIQKTLLYLSVHLGDFIEQIKKVCHIHFKAITVLLHYYVLQDKSGQSQQLFASRKSFRCQPSG